MSGGMIQSSDYVWIQVSVSVVVLRILNDIAFASEGHDCANIMSISYSQYCADMVRFIIQKITFPVCMDIAIFSIFRELHLFSFLPYHH